MFDDIWMGSIDKFVMVFFRYIGMEFCEFFNMCFVNYLFVFWYNRCVNMIWCIVILINYYVFGDYKLRVVFVLFSVLFYCVINFFGVRVD